MEDGTNTEKMKLKRMGIILILNECTDCHSPLHYSQSYARSTRKQYTGHVKLKHRAKH
jgi:recombinational DNA repair protein (RecF pathway)